MQQYLRRLKERQDRAEMISELALAGVAVLATSTLLALLIVLIWMLIIFGIPTVLGLIWWIRHEMKKEP